MTRRQLLFAAAFLISSSVTSYTLGSHLGVQSFVNKYDHSTSPAGFHCWNEVNSSQPYGVEKVCVEVVAS